jgi:esterase
MQLYSQDYGGGDCHETIILLHGLLGSSRNWVTVGKLLAKDHHFIGLDLRNHGKSPHDPAMSYSIMVDDVGQWMDEHGLKEAHIAGHSMGGKVGMLLACTNPDRVKTLTIVDIAPKAYAPHFQIAFDAMSNIDPSLYKGIAEVDRALATYIDDPVLRQFLLTNLKRNPAGTFDWQINLNGITRALPELSANPLKPDMVYTGPCLLLHGSKSDFVKPDDRKIVINHFPECKMLEVPDSGHNVHIDNRHFFSDQMLKMLRL